MAPGFRSTEPLPGRCFGQSFGSGLRQCSTPRRGTKSNNRRKLIVGTRHNPCEQLELSTLRQYLGKTPCLRYAEPFPEEAQVAPVGTCQNSRRSMALTEMASKRPATKI